MSMFVQKLKEDMSVITHKFVNHLEVRSRRPADGAGDCPKDLMACEMASSRLILYASHWLNHMATENITAEKHAFYIESASVKECCGVLEHSPLLQKYQIFEELVCLVKRLQRVNARRTASTGGPVSFSLSG